MSSTKTFVLAAGTSPRTMCTAEAMRQNGVAFSIPTIELDHADVNPGYHLREITKGMLGLSSKIREEVEELMDSEEQGIRIMVHNELADIYGALEAYAKRQGLTMEDLQKMSDATSRAFASGRRG